MKRIDFYKKYEGEPYFTFKTSNKEICIKIWEGFIWDIFGDPYFYNDGFHGITKYFQERDYDECYFYKISNIDDAIDDLKKYKDKIFKFDSFKVYLELLNMLNYCKKTESFITIQFYEL